MSRPQIWKLIGAILLVCTLPLQSTPQDKAVFIPFDAPGSVQGTFPTAISPAGVIVGYVIIDNNNTPNAFIRARDGTFIPFDPLAPGPGSLANLGAPGGSKALGINPEGEITGYYLDVNFVAHGFLRAPNGMFTNIDPPDSLSCNPIAINPAGAITGNYADGNTGLNRGFLRSPNGIVTSIDPPGSQSSNGTAPQALNPAGAVTGFFQDTNAIFPGFRAFLRTPDGTITVFDPPEDVASPGSEYIVPSGINPAGVIAGSYQPQYGQPFYHGFLRAPNGTFTVIDLPNSASNQGTFIFGINPKGTVTGYYFANNANHGFLRTRGGKFTTFDGPAGSPSDLLPPSTQPSALNPAGEITGTYVTTDANFVSTTRGFLRIPAHEDEGEGLAGGD
jgi:hypothetical protein